MHSGDSACSLLAYILSKDLQDIICQQVAKLAFELQVRGLMNVQFVVKNHKVYLIEVNLRVIYTILFVSKATGVLLSKVAAWGNGGQKYWLSQVSLGWLFHHSTR